MFTPIKKPIDFSESFFGFLTSSMSEIELEILFPKLGKDPVRHTFSLEKDASSILEYATSKYADVSATSQIFMVNDQKLYQYVAPEDVLNTLDLHPNHEILIMPESYDLTIYDVDNRKEHHMKLYNNYTVAEVMQVICVRHQLLDPKYYEVTTGAKILNPDIAITEQAPWATTINFHLAQPIVLYEKLTREFLDSDWQCQPKDVHYIIACMLAVKIGAFKNTGKTQYEQEIKEMIPKHLQEDVMFTKNCGKSVTDIYKKMKVGDQFMEETVDYIMKLQHFSALVVAGERTIGVMGKKPTKDKVTISLNYSILRVYKLNSQTLLEQFNIINMINPTMEPNCIKFDYDMPEKGGRMTIRCRADEMRQFYDLITDRLATPASKGRGSSAGSRAGANDQAMAVPAFVLAFNLFGDIPKSELHLAVASSVVIFMDELSDLLDKHMGDVNGAKGGETARQISGFVRIVASLLHAVDKDMCNDFWTASENVAKKSGAIRAKVQEVYAAKIVHSDLVADVKKAASKEAAKAMTDFVERQTELENLTNEFNDEVEHVRREMDDIKNTFAAKMEEKSLFSVRQIFVNMIRTAILQLLVANWVNDTQVCRETIDQLKTTIVEIVKQASSINVYAGGHTDLLEEVDKVVKIAGEMIVTVERLDRTERDKQYMIIMQDKTKKELEYEQRELVNYFAEHPPLVLVEPMSMDEISTLNPDDPRPLATASRQCMERLTSNAVDDMADAIKNLESIKAMFIRLMGMAQKSACEPLVNTYNDFKLDIERSYATNGTTSASPAEKRCERALESLLQSMNPAKELRQQLEQQLSKDDPRVIALSAIIDYLEQNGPLYTGSATQLDLQRFISAMSMAKTETLVELAYTIESYVPENLRHLSDTCDPTRDLYKEVEGEMDVAEISQAAMTSASNVAKSAFEMRKALKKQEHEVSAKYRALNLRLWRMMVVFGQFAQDESPGSVGYVTFNQCKDAIKTLVEESAYDIKRDRQFLPFIDEFSEKVDKVIDCPRDSQNLAALGGFLMRHQTRPGFYKAAKALSSYNHFVVVTDSNRAAKELVEQVIVGQKFRSVSLMIAQLKRRFATLLSKVDMQMKTKRTNDRNHCGVDLRGEYQMFLRKYTEQLFIIFSQLVVAKSTNQMAIQALSGSCDAIEKLCPLVMNTEVSAPYFARSVCGIVFSSMESIIAECKTMGGKAEQSSGFAFLAVREFLFHVRRKIAEAEREAMSQKTGIGIADMYAVIDREQKVIREQTEFQKSIRRRRK